MTKTLLIERYLDDVKAQVERRVAEAQLQGKSDVVVASRASYAQQQALMEDLEKILLPQSGRTMLLQLLERPDVLARAAPDEAIRATWIKFQEPILHEPLEVHALLLIKLYDQQRIVRAATRSGLSQEAFHGMSAFRDTWSLDLLNDEGKPHFHLFFRPQNGWKLLQQFHNCPYGECFVEENIFISCPGCPGCQEQVAYWSVVLETALLMRHRYFARKEFQTQIFRVRHETAKKEKKKQPHFVSYVFQVIDASVHVLPEEPKEVLSPRGSWIEQALAEDPHSIEYIDKPVGPFKRTYRHPRYVNVQGQTQEIVIPNRHTPVLKKRVGKQWKKVEARDYEEEGLS